ncbi:uncharacterized protein BN781_00786 [Coprococcus sp. CAG:782]|nr:uncharacterized protein BN781_00786 [Coprococcus sp. CAG:782]
MLPVMAGYCYFDIKNYDTFSGEYNLYIDWDMELMEYLAYPLPSGGYFVKVTSEQADDFNELGEGVPVYMKLIGKNGQIYSYRTYLVYRGRPYSIEFSGAELIPFEEKIQKCMIGGSQRPGMSITGSQRFSIGGSQRHGMGVTGSQRHVGSQRPTIMGKLPEVYTPTEDWTMIPKEWQLINRTRRPDTDKGGNARLGYGLDLI